MGLWHLCSSPPIQIRLGGRVQAWAAFQTSGGHFLRLRAARGPAVSARTVAEPEPAGASGGGVLFLHREDRPSEVFHRGFQVFPSGVCRSLLTRSPEVNSLVFMNSPRKRTKSRLSLFSVYLTPFVCIIHILFVKKWKERGFLPVLQRWLPWGLSVRLLGLRSIQIRAPAALGGGGPLFLGSLPCSCHIALTAFCHHSHRHHYSGKKSLSLLAEQRWQWWSEWNEFTRWTWKWPVCPGPEEMACQGWLSLGATFSPST